MGMLLDNAGYDLTLVADGQQACEALQTGQEYELTDHRHQNAPHGWHGPVAIMSTKTIPTCRSSSSRPLARSSRPWRSCRWARWITSPSPSKKRSSNWAIERGPCLGLGACWPRTANCAARWPVTAALETMIAQSKAMKDMLALARKVAQSNANVMIYGESGTGKEVITRGIHHASPRAGGPFVPINCAAIPDTLLESELFGHEKGAFTGATERKLGKFELAEKGNVVPGRNWRPGPARTGQGAASDRKPRDPARGRHRGDQHRCAVHRGHQQRPAASRGARRVPR